MEYNGMGEVKAPEEHYWGEQTERARRNFPVGLGTEPVPRELLRAFGVLKKAAARANFALSPGNMTEEKCAAIFAAADEIIRGRLDEEFPLSVWQSGSGTQTNRNVNEVIARRGSEMADEPGLLDPDEDVNMSQSSHDVFPAALHIAAALAVEDALLPAAEGLIQTLGWLEKENADAVKLGRTHAQDSMPLTFGQEASGWRASLEKDCAFLRAALPGLYELSLGATAVGTGYQAPKGFGEAAAEQVARLTGKPFVSAPNKFHALTSLDELVFAHGAMKALAADLLKIAGDVRRLSSGPRGGLGELSIPANEPASPAMPGKVDAAQCEQAAMAAVQVMGNDAALGFAASQGELELNTFFPVAAYDFLQSARLLADSIASFDTRCMSGVRADRETMYDTLYCALTPIAALRPYIGADNAAQVAQKAYDEGLTLRDACIALGYLSAAEFDKVFHPEEMV